MQHRTLQRGLSVTSVAPEKKKKTGNAKGTGAVLETFGQRSQILAPSFCIRKNEPQKKNGRILSMKYWLFNRDPYFMVYYNHLGSISSPINPKQPGWPFFHCSNGFKFVCWGSFIR